MALFLVVAHQTSASPGLVRRLQEISEQDKAAEFVLLVPATPARHLLTWVEGDATAIARERAELASQTFRRAGLDVTDTVVGVSDPLEAIKAEHRTRDRPYAATIISTLPAGLSRWLRRDLPGQVRRQLGVQVEHIEVRTTAAEPRRGESAVAGGVTIQEGLPPDLRELTEWRGRPIYGRDGYLGEVHEILYDYMSLEPVWLGMPSKPVPFRTLLAPAARVRITNGRLSVPFSREKVMAQPHIDVGQGFPSLTDEERLYQYFGLPFGELRDVRVLRLGQELPGTEINVQSITAAEVSQR